MVLHPNIVIKTPICTAEERQAIITGLRNHKQFSRRNAQQTYLCFGMIFDEDDHLYTGRKMGNVIRYCNYKQSHSIDGKIEDAVKDKVRELFSYTDESFYQRFAVLDRANKPDLEAELSREQKKLDQIINQQANFVRNLSRISSDAFDPEAIEKASLNLKTDLFMANKRITDVKNEIAEADAVAERVASFLTIKERFIDVSTATITFAGGNY